MTKNHIKNLKNEIKRLKKENQFLQIGIDNREEAHDHVFKENEKHMAVTQELTFLLVYMEVIEAILKDDFSFNAMTIKKAITKFKLELTDGFAENHLIHNLHNNDYYEKAI